MPAAKSGEWLSRFSRQWILGFEAAGNGLPQDWAFGVSRVFDMQHCFSMLQF